MAAGAKDTQLPRALMFRRGCYLVRVVQPVLGGPGFEPRAVEFYPEASLSGRPGSMSGDEPCPRALARWDGQWVCLTCLLRSPSH